MGGALGIKGTLGTAEKISRSVPDFTSNRTMSGSPEETPMSSNRRPTRTQPSRHVLRPNVCLFWFPGDRQTGVGETKKVVRDDGPLSIKQWVTVNWDGEDVPGLILALGASRPAVTKILDNVDCERLPTEYTPGQKFWEGEWEAETHQERNNHNESQHTQENEPRKKRKRQPKQQPTGGEVAPSPKKAIISVGGRMIQVLAADVAGWKTAEEGDLVTATYAKRMVDGRLMKIGHLQDLRMRCHYSQQFAQKLSKIVITPEEFLSKNCSGTKGKGAHDKEKLGRIREATQMYFHLSDKAMEVEWKQCVKQIDEWGRYLKKRGSKALQAKENMPIA